MLNRRADQLDDRLKGLKSRADDYRGQCPLPVRTGSAA